MACRVPLQRNGCTVVDLLRLWKSEAVESFDFQAFNVGDYYGAVHEKIASETITKILYSNDDPAIGKRLRLSQQYFFVSCSLRNMIRIHELQGNPIAAFSDGFAAQLSDTHPAIAVPELMRILEDECRIDWDEAWAITQKTFSYTNHIPPYWNPEALPGEPDFGHIQDYEAFPAGLEKVRRTACASLSPAAAGSASSARLYTYQ